MKLLSSHCPKCNVLVKKLESKNVPYELVDDIDTVTKLAEEHGVRELPLLICDDNTALGFNEAVKFVNSL